MRTLRGFGFTQRGDFEGCDILVDSWSAQDSKNCVESENSKDSSVLSDSWDCEDFKNSHIVGNSLASHILADSVVASEQDSALSLRDVAGATSRQSIALESASVDGFSTLAITENVDFADSRDSHIAGDSVASKKCEDSKDSKEILESKDSEDSKSGALALIEKPLRALKKGEVLVRNLASALNPVDYKLLDFFGAAQEGQIMGLDGVGVVVESQSEAVELGALYAYHADLRYDGSFADLTILPARALLPLAEYSALSEGNSSLGKDSHNAKAPLRLGARQVAHSQSLLESPDLSSQILEYQDFTLHSSFGMSNTPHSQSSHSPKNSSATLECLAESSTIDSKEVSESTASKSRTISEFTASDTHSISESCVADSKPTSESALSVIASAALRSNP